MIANIRDYVPSEITFPLTDAIREKFPTELFIGAEKAEEVIKQVTEHFNALFPENETALRNLDSFEIQEIREEYCELTENILPIRSLELEEAIETAKRIKKEAEDALQAISETIRSLAKQVKDGTKEYKLSSRNTFRIALNGYFLYYSWVNDKCQLVKAVTIPAWDKRSLWAQEDKNREAMMELFGYDIPNEERPKDEEIDF